MSDYRIEVKVKNANILRAIKKNGYDNVNRFCVANGLSATLFGEYVNLKRSPVNKHGDWMPFVIKVAEALDVMPSNLFSHEQLIPLDNNKSSADVSMEDIGTLLPAPVKSPLKLMLEQDAKVTVDAALERLLTEREAKVLRALSGIDQEPKTWRQIGEELDISHQRVRHIEANALRKLRGANGINGAAPNFLRDALKSFKDADNDYQ